MVIERVELVVTTGRETEFETAMAKEGRALLAGAAGCSAVHLCRCVERPARYLLMLHWNSVDAHTAFTQTPEFAQFRQVAGPYFAEKPAMEHFVPVAAN